jgi:Tol biopolymer transport system component/tRNA A-37 threonylcarbamoyl transferase component Bud32
MTSITEGARVGRYEVRSRIGEGGMGEVYAATDTELGRPVALKFLHAEVAADERRMSRFIQEARATSALNHPNIVTVYEVGQTDEGVRFFATELIDGETLRARMNVGAMKLGEVLEVAIQIASALVAAHAAGIVHRDIKPENVMLRRDGYVKVLDFGLAKLAGTDSTSVDTQAATRALVQTDPGSIMGTVAYMSPEQASGKETDARTDIWSLGVVLYEMLAGRVPFAGKSLSHTIVAILDEEPPPLARFMADAPEALQEIVSDALAKDLEARFQTAKQMLAKLRRLKGRLDAGAHLDRSVAFSSLNSGSSSASGTGSQSSNADTIIGATPTVSVAAATNRTNEATAATPTVSSVEQGSGKTKRYGRGALVALSLFVIVAAGVAFGLYKYFGESRSVQPVGAVKVTPLTSWPGVERSVSFSPDGRQVAFTAIGEAGNFDIYVKIVGAGEALRLTSDPAREMSPSFSPDGRFIAFLRGDGENKGFYLIPALGGAERKVADAYGWHQQGIMAQAIDWSPDGKTLAVVDKTSPDEPWAIFLLSVETGEKRRLTQAPAQSVGDTLVAFSPDGRTLAFMRMQDITGDIYLVPTSGGEPVRVTSDEKEIHGLGWTPDGASLVFSSERGGGSSTLWRILARSGGTPTPVVGAGTNVHDLAVARQGDRLAYAQLLYDVNIYRMELTGPPGAQKAGASSSLISSTLAEESPQFSPDGRRVAFISDRTGSDEVWTCDAEGKNASQLTSFGGAHVESLGWSPDGRTIAFSSNAGGNTDIYLIGADGGSPRRLNNESSNETMPSWSRDGRSILFTSNRTGRPEVWKMPAAGGEAVQLTRAGGTNPLESADGRAVYFIKGRQQPDVWQVSADGGEETRVCEGKISEGNWVVTERGIYFLDWQTDSRAYALAYFDFATRKTTRLTTLTNSKPSFAISGITLSPDGRQLLYAQRDQLEFDLMLVENFR